MKYFVCTEINMKCPACGQYYNIRAKDSKPIDTFDVECKCGTKCKEVNEYGGFLR